jgi:Zn-finger nucleic acid-binding protein
MIGNTAVHECSECGGYWVERSVFESLCSSKEEQATVLAFDRTRARAGAGEDKIRYVPCPKCGELMNRSNFARSSGVVIDICKQHGVWFDADELTKVIEFIQIGGASIAREREKLDIEEQRSRLREEQFKIDRLDGPSASGWDDLSIGGFIKRLFE